MTFARGDVYGEAHVLLRYFGEDVACFDELSEGLRAWCLALGSTLDRICLPNMRVAGVTGDANRDGS